MLARARARAICARGFARGPVVHARRWTTSARGRRARLRSTAATAREDDDDDDARAVDDVWTRALGPRATATTWVWASEAYDVRGDGEGRCGARTRATRAGALSVAPMMEYTTAHFRVMCRLMSAKTWLWTEMEVDQTLTHAVLEGTRVDRFLDYPVETAATVLQLGGSDPEILGRATAIAAPYGYEEINLNSGCPSPKVAGKGCFGAALMTEPRLVAECLQAMNENAPSGTPVSIKCRIGVDECDSYDELC